MKLTKSEAVAQGYTSYGYGDNSKFQFLHSIEHLGDDDFENHTIYAAEKEPYYSPSINPEDLAELIAEYIECNNNDETGDDTEYVYKIVKELDFSATASLINEAVKHSQYYRLSDIEIIPDPPHTS